MTQSGNKRAVALFGHLKEGTGLNTPPLGTSSEDRDANGNDFYVFASDREITVTDADAGPSLRMLPIQEIQYFIMRFMELLTGRNAFAIDFWANPIAQSQVRDYKARTLHAPEVARHAEEPPHQTLSNNVSSRIDGYIQNPQFQIQLLYKLTILSIQHVLEGNTKETLIDLVSMCDALLRFAEGPAPGARAVNGRLLDSPTDALSRWIQQDQQPFWNKQSSHITEQSLFTPIDPPELSINMTQKQFNAHKGFWVQRSYSLIYIGLRSSGEHHRGFDERLITFWRELDTELFLDTVRMDLDEDNHHHHHHHNHEHDYDYDHKHDKGDLNCRGNCIEHEQGRKRRRVDFSVGPQDDWSQGLQRQQANECQIPRQRLREFRIGQNQQLNYWATYESPRVLPTQLSNLRTAREEAFRRQNNIPPNLVEQSSDSWTSAASINQEELMNVEIPNFQTTQLLFAQQDNEDQLNQQMNEEIREQIAQLTQVNGELQMHQQIDPTVNEEKNAIRQPEEHQNSTQTIQINATPNNEQVPQEQNENDNGRNNGVMDRDQPPQHSNETNNTQFPENNQNEDLNNRMEINQTQSSQTIPGLLNLLQQTSLLDTISLNIQHQTSSSFSSSSLTLNPVKTKSNSKFNQSLFVTDPNQQFIRRKQHSGYIPFNEAVNQLPLIPTNPEKKAKIKKKKKNGRKHRRGNKHKNNHAQTLFQYDNEVPDSHFGARSSQMGYLGPPWRAPDQSYMTLRSRSPTSRRLRVTYPTLTNSHKQTTPHPNYNQSSILDVDLVVPIIKSHTIPKGTQLQHSAEEAAQVQHASGDTSLVIGNVIQRASSTHRTGLREVEIADVKVKDNQTAPPTNTRRYLLRGPQVGKEGSTAPVRSKDTCTNTSVVANQNVGQNQHR
ncbi:MAG: hypothetical protein EZS28_027130 [Streblomastix strix]|uniref:Uncharacterized protein n=1 Tax=Streblomastix strix TaxID=222440 RepID=A0A5J4V5E8_9EUKA|nr:MAG: hypothetical protein EZS28_027130 [Streblomastix strix]